MKTLKKCFARFETEGIVRWGLVAGLLVEEILPNPFGAYSPTGLIWPLKKVRLLAPVLPSKIVAVGVNYADHAKEFGKAPPPIPLLFLKPPSAVIGPGDVIEKPAVSHQVDFEGEIAVVIGRRARNISRAAAEKYILGYTLMNDVTARDLQRTDGQWSRAKGFDTFAPLGPWVMCGIPSRKITLQTYVNGRRRQSSSTQQLVFDIPTLVSHISHVMTLEPGDIISTGTPAGVGPLQSGDRVEIRSPEIGRLINTVGNRK